MSKQRVDVAPVIGMETQLGLLLAMLDDNTRDWREELGEVSEEALVWQPVAEGHSIGALLLHIADVEAYWLYEVATGTPRTIEELASLLSEETQQYDGQWPLPPCRPLSWYYEQHDTIRARTHQAVRHLNDQEHTGKRQDTEFTLRWLLHHVITHEAYHGGQAVLLALIHDKLTAKT